MKREVWVEIETSQEQPGVDAIIAKGADRYIWLKRETLHESRWIPVSEKPEREGRYPVVFYSEKEFSGSSSYWDGNNWTGHVRLWLEAPPLPVEDEFEKWWDEHGHPVGHHKEIAKLAWDAAKGL